MHFVWRKIVCLFKFHRSLFLVSNWQKCNMDCNKGMSPNRQQAITWTKDDNDLRPHMASVGNNDKPQEHTEMEFHLIFKHLPHQRDVSISVWEIMSLTNLKMSTLYENRIFQCMGKIFCVKFQRYPLEFQTKYLTHTLNNAKFLQCFKFTSSQIYELGCVFKHPQKG